MTIQIKRGIPIPPAQSSRSRYPFAMMEVGECFMVPVGDNHAVVSSRIRSAAANHSQKHGGKYVVRYLPAEQVIGCWRTA